MSKPGKVLKALCKRLKVRLTVKRNGKRVYKSIKVLKSQCKRKAGKKKKVKRRKRRRRFGMPGMRLRPPSDDGRPYPSDDETKEDDPKTPIGRGPFRGYYRRRPYQNLRKRINNIEGTSSERTTINYKERDWKTWRQIEPKGRQVFDELLDKIKTYENNQTKTSKMFKDVRKFIGEYDTNKFCWMRFIQKVASTKWRVIQNSQKTRIYIDPNKDNKIFTSQNLDINNPIQRNDGRNYTISYDSGGKKKVIAITFKDIVMTDYDFKDQDFDLSLAYLIDGIYGTLVEESEKINKPMAFIKFQSDRGLHFFLASKRMKHNSLETIDLLNTLLVDPWYTAILYLTGFAIRIASKEDDEEYGKYKDDFIGKPMSIPHKYLISEAFQKEIDKHFLAEKDYKVRMEKYNMEKETSKKNWKDILKYFSYDKVKKPFVKIELSSGEMMNFEYTDYLYYKADGVEKHIIGDIRHIKEDIWKDLMFHYFVIQYFKRKGVQIKNDIECDAGRNLLGINTEENELDMMRIDIEKIYKASQKLKFRQRFGVFLKEYQTRMRNKELSKDLYAQKYNEFGKKKRKVKRKRKKVKRKRKKVKRKRKKVKKKRKVKRKRKKVKKRVKKRKK